MKTEVSKSPEGNAESCLEEVMSGLEAQAGSRHGREQGTQAKGRSPAWGWHTADTSPFLSTCSSAESQRCLGNMGILCGCWGYEDGEPGGTGTKYEQAQNATPHS